MRICIDLDGVICHLRQPGETYADVAPIPGAVESIREMRSAGHVVIIHTARHMKTCEGNVGAVIARIGQLTLDWLARHEVEYDEIIFGKPWADVYLDDNAMRFTSWSEISAETLPTSSERRMAGAGSR
jgi:capsule biosynthesis phosphatase